MSAPFPERESPFAGRMPQLAEIIRQENFQEKFDALLKWYRDSRFKVYSVKIVIDAESEGMPRQTREMVLEGGNILYEGTNGTSEGMEMMGIVVLKER
jgi:hypothetical protein